MRLKINECKYSQDLQVVEDIEHIFCECSALLQTRLQELGSYFLLPQELVDIRTTNTHTEVCSAPKDPI